jgi:hypothetical protein
MRRDKFYALILRRVKQSKGSEWSIVDSKGKRKAILPFTIDHSLVFQRSRR